MLLRLAFFAPCLFWVLLATTCSADTANRYDAACDAIVEAAQMAARAQRAGNIQGADRFVKMALDRFESAKALAPNEPQAYMHAATFLGNIHRFDEALEMWDKVVPLLPENRRDLHQHVAAQRNEINYGKVSKERDSVYKLGEGDIDAAVTLVHRQLKMYYSPRILFDLGTLQALQSERVGDGTATFARSVENYAEAQRVTVRAAAKYMSHLREASRHSARQRDTKACPRKTKIHSNKQGSHVKNNSKLGFFRYPLSSLATVTRDGVAMPEYAESYDLEPFIDEDPSAMHLNTLKGASLSGPQGVISKLHKCRLHVWETFEAPFTEWHGNFWLAEDWKTNVSFSIYDHSLERRFPPPGPSEYNKPRQHVKGQAVSLVGFSPTNYYHWLMGALPRLVVLFPTLKASPDMRCMCRSPQRGVARCARTRVA